MDEVNFNKAHGQDNTLYPHEKIAPAVSSDNSVQGSDEKDRKYGGVHEKEIGVEATQTSSLETDSEEDFSKRSQFLKKYAIFGHLLIWLVMTG
jgi:hypothetical protein